MTSVVAPMCTACTHLVGYVDGVLTCAPYAEGIPPEITDGLFDHRQPWTGDGGVTFNQSDEFSEPLWHTYPFIIKESP